MDRFLQALISGILMGGVYATIAVGLSLAFGVMRIINWAHGQLLMVSMYVASLIIGATNWNPYLVSLLTGLIFVGVGYLIQGTMINPILKKEQVREPMSVLLFTSGLGMVLTNLCLIIFSANPIMVHTDVMGKTISVGNIIISVARLISFIISILGTVSLYVFLQKTEVGRAIRATSQNRQVANLMGINQNKIYKIAFAIGIGLLGLAGGLLVPFFSVYPFVGQTFSTKSFIIVVLGGKGSVIGALFGGLLVGIVESVIGQFVTDTYAQAAVFLLFIIVLLFKPAGLMGKKSDIV